MANSILIGSGKGGVGKTTVTINLGFVLTQLGKDVVVVDVDLPTPNVGMHLDIPSNATTLNDVVKGNASLKDAIYYNDYGMKIIPSGHDFDALEGFNTRVFNHTMKQINSMFDIVLYDCAPGLGNEVIHAFKGGQKMLVVTNPEKPSVNDCTKAIQIAQDLGVQVKGIIVNRCRRFKEELKNQEISERLYGLPILGNIPEDSTVASSVSKGKPVVLSNPLSPSSREFRQLGHLLIGKPYEENFSPFEKIKILLKQY